MVVATRLLYLDVKLAGYPPVFDGENVAMVRVNDPMAEHRIQSGFLAGIQCACEIMQQEAVSPLPVNGVPSAAPIQREFAGRLL
jgi:hypothetical protein